MTQEFALLLVIGVSLGLGANLAAAADAPSPEGFAVFSPPRASWLETLAAREVRRYVYLRTGQLVPIVEVAAAVPEVAAGIVVAEKQRPVVAALATDEPLKAAVDGLGAEHYLLKTLGPRDRPIVLVSGGDGVGTLYGAYRLAEHLGVRFYLHGDVIPDERIPPALPDVSETGKPLFELRGIQPFHDFPEGPDWWNADEYKAYISQLPKLRMNFIGLHTYPEGGPNAEPTVWIGPPSEVGEDGRVKASYPSSYQNTLRGNWGYAPKKTADYVLGADQLFDRDDYGADVMRGQFPQPMAPAACNELFDRTAAMLREAFRLARQLGVKTCVGTETPLTIPKLVQERLKAAGKDLASPAVRQELYEGIFTRIARAYPLDYYWFWTPEGWTWEGTKQEQVNATITDLQAAIAAAQKVRAPFKLATCGWVLGPPNDRALFDKTLPKDVAVSCINRQVGMEPVEPGFAKVTGRGKWAIPWLEDDPALTAPQLWAGRMREDAVDARRYGCNGLMGIHWRTRILAPNMAALAQAAWDQSWHKAAVAPPQPEKVEGAVGGNFAAFPNNAIADTQDAPLYQTVRWNVSAYHFKVPDGAYTVTLKFCEPHYAEAGKRVFGVKLQGKTVIDTLDIFAKAGPNRALDYKFNDIQISGGWLDIDFIHQVEFPCIAAVVIEGAGVSRKINCGGPAYKDYAADWPPAGGPQPRGLPITDFYADWALAEFGPHAGPKAAEIFARIDGRLPRPADWVDGPGGLKVDGRPWEQAAKEYAFVDELAALRPLVKGAGYAERFDYWLNQFCYMRAMAQVDCTAAVLNQTLEQLKAEKDAGARQRLARESALPVYKQLLANVREVYKYLLAVISTPGEMGTVMNWEQHLFPRLLAEPAQRLTEALRGPLPADAQLERVYSGPLRVIVPTVRSSLAAGETLTLRAVVLAEKPPREVTVLWRPLGKGDFRKLPMKHAARGVYTVELPPAGAEVDALEYHLQVAPEAGDPVYFPATAPQMNQTVVVTPPIPSQ